MKIRSAWSAAGLTLCVGVTFAPPASMQAPLAVVLRNVTIIPMDAERIVAAQTVIVRGLTIESVGPTSATPPPPGAVVIDGTGRFLIPGFTDTPVHLPGPTTPVDRVEAELYL